MKNTKFCWFFENSPIKNSRTKIFYDAVQKKRCQSDNFLKISIADVGQFFASSSWHIKLWRVLIGQNIFRDESNFFSTVELEIEVIIRENFLHILVIMKMMNLSKNMQMQNAMEKVIEMLHVIMVHVMAMFIILNL